MTHVLSSIPSWKVSPFMIHSRPCYLFVTSISANKHGRLQACEDCSRAWKTDPLACPDLAWPCLAWRKCSLQGRRFAVNEKAHLRSICDRSANASSRLMTSASEAGSTRPSTWITSSSSKHRTTCAAQPQPSFIIRPLTAVDYPDGSHCIKTESHWHLWPVLQWSCRFMTTSKLQYQSIPHILTAASCMH